MVMTGVHTDIPLAIIMLLQCCKKELTLGEVLHSSLRPDTGDAAQNDGIKS